MGIWIDEEEENIKESLINLLEIMIATIKEDDWLVPEYSLNVDNDLDYHCNVPTRIRGKSYNLKFELRNCERKYRYYGEKNYE